MAARPKTLPAAIVPVWAASVLAWRLEGRFDARLAVLTVLGAIAIQIATNFFNDAIDARKGADTARRLGPTRVTASGLLSRWAVLAWAWAFLAIALACGVLLYQACGWPIVAIGIPSLFLAYGYTGGPFPLAYRGMGEIFVIGFFGIIAVGGSFFIQTGQWPASAILLGIQVGLLSAVLISINNFRDRAEDATTGKRSLAVRVGPHAARALIWLELALAATAGLAWLASPHPMAALASLPIVIIGSYLALALSRDPSGPSCNRLLAIAGIQLIIFAATFHAIAMFVR